MLIMTKNLLLFVSTDDYEPEFGIEGYRCTVGNIKEATEKLDEIDYFDSAQLLEVDEDGLRLYAKFEIQYENVVETQRTKIEGWRMWDGLLFRVARETKQQYIPPPSERELRREFIVADLGGGSASIGPQGRWENVR